MLLIERYILRKITFAFFLILFIVVSITWVIQLLSHIDFLTTTGQTLWVVIKYSLLFIPSAIPLVLPFTLVLSLLYVLTSLHHNSELVIINNAGGSRKALFRPFIIAAIFISFIAFMTLNFLAPYTRTMVRNITANIQGSAISLLRPGTFQKISSNLFIHIRHKHNDNLFSDIMIMDQRAPHLDVFYYAHSAKIQSLQNQQFLILKDGQIKRQSTNNQNLSLISFGEYSLNLNELFPHSRSVNLYPKDLPLTELLLKTYKTDLQFTPTQYQAELHKRLSDWLYPILFTLTTLFFSATPRPHRHSPLWENTVSLSVCFLFYWLAYICQQWASTQTIFSITLYIIPLTGLVIFTFLLQNNFSPSFIYFFKKMKNYGEKNDLS